MEGLYEGGYYYGVTYGNDRFVCVGDGGYYTTDNEHWIAMTGLPEDYYEYYSVTYGNNRFICVGYEGRSYYSTNGTSWIAMSGLDTNYIYHGISCGEI